MSQPFGMPPRAARPCDHRGLWETATLAGYGVMFCEGCGKTYFLKKAESGDLYFQEALHIDEQDLADAPVAPYAGHEEEQAA